MVDRFTSKALELPSAERPFSRADLIFYGLDHSGASYEARVFLGTPSNLDRDAGPDHPGYAGSLFLFGHGGCFGDEGHCDVPQARDPFDVRLPHPLEPAIAVLTVTDAIEGLVDAGKSKITVTVVAHATGDAANDVLTFETVRLATYA